MDYLVAKMLHNFKKLVVWKKSMDLAKSVYQLIKLLPIQEKYNLIDQLRRASLSVPSNIAEGCSRSSVKEFKYFLSIALGSTYEIETQLLFAIEMGFIKKDLATETLKKTDELQKMLFVLRSKN